MEDCAGEEWKTREPFNLSRVVRECVEPAKPLASARDARILPVVPPTECFGNWGGKRSAAREAKFMLPFIAISDSGERITAEDLPHIFECFYRRVDKSRTHVQGRTGLGLAICKAVVDAHGGTIGVETQLGSGSMFTVRLPRAAPILSE